MLNDMKQEVLIPEQQSRRTFPKSGEEELKTPSLDELLSESHCGSFGSTLGPRSAWAGTEPQHQLFHTRGYGCRPGGLNLGPSISQAENQAGQKSKDRNATLRTSVRLSSSGLSRSTVLNVSIYPREHYPGKAPDSEII